MAAAALLSRREHAPRQHGATQGGECLFCLYLCIVLPSAGALGIAPRVSADYVFVNALALSVGRTCSSPALEQ